MDENIFFNLEYQKEKTMSEEQKIEQALASEIKTSDRLYDEQEARAREMTTIINQLALSQTIIKTGGLLAAFIVSVFGLSILNPIVTLTGLGIFLSVAIVDLFLLASEQEFRRLVNVRAVYSAFNKPTFIKVARLSVQSWPNYVFYSINIVLIVVLAIFSKI